MYGALLFCKERRELVRFKVWTMKEYGDFRWLQETYTRGWILGRRITDFV